MRNSVSLLSKHTHALIYLLAQKPTQTAGEHLEQLTTLRLLHSLARQVRGLSGAGPIALCMMPSQC